MFPARASVYIKGANYGTTSNVDGYFKLPLPIHAASKAVLVVSFIGYITQEITIDLASTKPLVVLLDEAHTLLGEVIIIQKPSLFKRVRNRFRSSR